MKTELEFHEAANIFPMMIDERLDDLADDIGKSGLRETIKLFDGKILDGRNRYLACLRADVEPRTEEVNLGGMSPTIYSLDMNLHRRHLSVSQRTMIGARAWCLFDKEDELLASEGGEDHTGIEKRKKLSRYDISKMVNVGGRTVHKGRAVLTGGIPDLVEAVDAGYVKVGPSVAISKLPKNEQPQAIAAAIAKKKTPKNKPAKKQTPRPPKCEINAEYVKETALRIGRIIRAIESRSGPSIGHNQHVSLLRLSRSNVFKSANFIKECTN